MGVAPSAFGTSVVDLFSCALLAMIVLWLTAMGSGRTADPDPKETIVAHFRQYHFEKVMFTSPAVTTPIVVTPSIPLVMCQAGSGLTQVQAHNTCEEGRLEIALTATSASSLGDLTVYASDWSTPFELELTNRWCSEISHTFEGSIAGSTAPSEVFRFKTACPACFSTPPMCKQCETSGSSTAIVWYRYGERFGCTHGGTDCRARPG